MVKREPKCLTEMTKHELLEYHIEDPMGWLCSGIGMLRAAFVVWSTYWNRFIADFRAGTRTPSQKDWMGFQCDRFVGTYTLICGLASENLLKGLLVAKRQLTCQNEKMPRELNTHDLQCLAADASLVLTPGELEVLANLTKVITWQGRYPGPKDISRIEKTGPEVAKSWGLAGSFPTVYVEILRGIAAEYASVLSVGQVDFITEVLNLVDEECPKDRPEDIQQHKVPE